MTAVTVHSPGGVELRSVPIPCPGPSEVLLRVSHCGVCGTDLGIVSGAFPVPRLPLVIGHEFVGRIAGLGARIDHVEPGQLVTVDPIMPCGTCHQCRRGRPALCQAGRELGIHEPGGMAEYVLARATNVHALPPAVSCLAGALVEPLACAIHGQDRARVDFGETVAIVGGGLQGLLHVMLARLRGAACVIVSARHRRRRELAKSLGADLVLDPDADDPATRVLELTDGRGADVVVEASGSVSGLTSALRIVGPGGRLLVHGAIPPHARVAVSPFDIFQREMSIVGSFGGTGDSWPRALELIAAGIVDPTVVVDAEWELNDAPAALEELRANREIVKGLVHITR
jgi:2-desacetyl-2-hydroxyethyl bacteriochlorophyllide A dehydrogenase